MDSKKKTTYNIITSAKGGCGKTTFSIELAAYINKNNIFRSFNLPIRENDINNRNLAEDIKRESLLLDADIMGTGMIKLFGFDEIDELSILYPNNDYCYLNDKIRDFETKGKEWIGEIYIPDKLNTISRINVIFSNPNTGKENFFREMVKKNYGVGAHVELFKSGMGILLSEINKKNKYTDIVFDMPPSTEPYSEAIGDYLVNEKTYTKLSENAIPVNNYFVVLNLDISHLRATYPFIEERIFGNDDNLPDNIFIVLNSNTYDDSIDNILNYRIDSMAKKLDSIFTKNKLNEEIMNHIYFVVANDFKALHNVSISDKGFINNSEIEKDLQFVYPIVYMDKYELGKEKYNVEFIDNIGILDNINEQLLEKMQMKSHP